MTVAWNPNNMVLFNYEGKMSMSLGVIQMDVVEWTTTWPFIFVVILIKVNYNLLLGREWIHGEGAVPSMLH